jgi:anti-sigma factor RsiW
MFVPMSHSTPPALVMTHCPRYERLAALLYDGELDGPLRREVRSHVAGCAACTRWLASVERLQEILSQEIDSQIERIDFSRFWGQVEDRLSAPPPPWFVRLRLWWEQWKANQPLGVPLGAATAALLLAAVLSLSDTDLSFDSFFSSPNPDPAAHSQAQIESLSAATTVALWNEPTSNAPVIWIEDDRDGAAP